MSAMAVSRMWTLLLPELRLFAPDKRDHALAVARATPLDTLELLAMAAALVLVTAVTRYVVPDMSLWTRVGAALVNFAVAIPLLTLALGPFHVRRLRRGLLRQLRGNGS